MLCSDETQQVEPSPACESTRPHAKHGTMVNGVYLTCVCRQEFTATGAQVRRGEWSLYDCGQ
jgi:hypothetical protein